MAFVPLSAFQGILVNGLSGESAQPISGYTLATPFVCSVLRDSIYTEAAITTDYSLIWWFGDGTYSTQFSPSHTYNWPGVYEVKLAVFNNSEGTLAVDNLSHAQIEDLKVNIGSNGDAFVIGVGGGIQASTFSVRLTANNYIQDSLSWDYSAWPDLSAGEPLSGACFHGFQSCRSGDGTKPIPLTFNYVTSILNNSDINFNFYAQNSLSQPWMEVPNSQLVNLRPRWRFTTVSSATADGDVVSSYNPVSSTEIRILSSGALSPTGTLVGLSGSVPFYYIDDIPSMVVRSTANTQSISANPTTIWITLDTNNIPNVQSYDYKSVPSYANSSVGLSSYYYVQTLVPDHIGITLNGLVPFFNTYWPRVESRFVTTINSSSNTPSYLSDKALLNFPVNILSGGNAYVVTLSTSAPNASAAFNLTSENPVYSNDLPYSLARVDNLSRDTGGYYIGTFTPYTTGTAILSAFSAAANICYALDLSPASATGYNPLYIPTTTTIVYNGNFQGSSSLFDIVDFNAAFFARKFGQGFDYGSVLKSYALQPTIAANEALFGTYLPAAAGVSATNDETYGTVVFEKIANFVSNVSDPSTANVSQFYALAASMSQNLDNYNYDIPPALSRIVDLYSTQQSRVWGSRSKYARNFANKTGHTNLGNELSAYNVYSTILTAGEKIVAQDLFNTEHYELLEVPSITSYASISARGLQNLFPPASALSFPLTTYPLSAFFGWGLTTPVANNYRFYVYMDALDNTQEEGLVNWDDPLTTLAESASAHQDWVKDEGILETIFNYYITKGLSLIK